MVIDVYLTTLRLLTSRFFDDFTVFTFFHDFTTLQLLTLRTFFAEISILDARLALNMSVHSKHKNQSSLFIRIF